MKSIIATALAVAVPALAVGAFVSEGGSANAAASPSGRAQASHAAANHNRLPLRRRPSAAPCTTAGSPSFVGVAGAQNVAGGTYGAVLGGEDNFACAFQSAIGAGLENVSSSDDGIDSFIGAGEANQTTAPYTLIGAGVGNVAAGEQSFIGAGYSNATSGQATYAFVGAGESNAAYGSASFVGAGGSAASSSKAGSNTASGQDAFVGAGDANTASGDGAFVGGGDFDLALAATKAATNGNAASGTDSFVGAGDAGIVYGTGSFIGAGGTTIAALVANTSTYANVVSGVDAFVGGGDLNAVSGNGSFIGAGGYASAASATAGHVQTSNGISSNDSFIGAGNLNNIAGNQSAIDGGESNRILSGANLAAIGGGEGNVVSGAYGVVGGGEANGASASFATIPGGYHNVASGVASFAAGYVAEAVNPGSFAWSDESSTTVHVKTTAANQFLARAAGGVYFFSNASLTSGVRLAPGSGAWSNLSDRAMKTGVTPLDDAAVLRKVAALPVSEWSYTSERGVRHVGPMAQDFYAAFGVGEDDRHITSIDEDGVALAAIKALHAENARLGVENAHVRADNARMRADILGIRRRLNTQRATDAARLEALERKVAALTHPVDLRRAP